MFASPQQLKERAYNMALMMAPSVGVALLINGLSGMISAGLPLILNYLIGIARPWVNIAGTNDCLKRSLILMADEYQKELCGREWTAKEYQETALRRRFDALLDLYVHTGLRSDALTRHAMAVGSSSVRAALKVHFDLSERDLDGKMNPRYQELYDRLVQRAEASP